MLSARSFQPISVCALVSALSILTACAGNAGLATGSVFEKGSARPVTGVEVTLVNKKDGKKVKAPVNYGGIFSVDLPAGSYSISVADGARQLCDEQIELTIAPNQMLEQQVCIVPEESVAPAATGLPDTPLQNTDPSAPNPSLPPEGPASQAPTSDAATQTTPVGAAPQLSEQAIPQSQPVGQPSTNSTDSAGTAPAAYPPAPGPAFPPAAPRQ